LYPQRKILHLTSRKDVFHPFHVARTKYDLKVDGGQPVNYILTTLFEDPLFVRSPSDWL